MNELTVDDVHSFSNIRYRNILEMAQFRFSDEAVVAIAKLDRSYDVFLKYYNR